MKKTLQQTADEQGISRQAVWGKTPKGRAYKRAYQRTYRRTEKYRAYDRHRHHLRVRKQFKNCPKCQETS